MSHRPDNKDCPLHPDGPKIISFDKPECTCKPTAADRLAEIRARHNATIFIDWGYDRASQPQSLSNAEQCHADRAELLSMIDARDKELEQVKADHAELVRACISDRVLTHDDSCGFNEYQWCDCAAGKASEKRIQAALANLQGSNKE